MSAWQDHRKGIHCTIGVNVRPGALRSLDVPLDKDAYDNYTTAALNLIITDRGRRLFSQPLMFRDDLERNMGWWRMDTLQRTGWEDVSLQDETVEETRLLEPMRKLSRSCCAYRVCINGVMPGMRTVPEPRHFFFGNTARATAG